MGARRLPSPNIFHVCLFFFTWIFPSRFYAGKEWWGTDIRHPAVFALFNNRTIEAVDGRANDFPLILYFPLREGSQNILPHPSENAKFFSSSCWKISDPTKWFGVTWRKKHILGLKLFMNCRHYLVCPEWLNRHFMKQTDSLKLVFRLRSAHSRSFSR